jgi:hypothetical protein
VTRGSKVVVKRHLFLKWCLTTFLTLIVISVVAYLSSGEIATLSSVAKIMVGVVGLIYLIANTYCGFLTWDTDSTTESGRTGGWFSCVELINENNRYAKHLRKLKHNADWVAHASYMSPYVGILGSVCGMFLFMHGTNGLGGVTDTNQLKTVIGAALDGIGTAFVPTIVGVFVMIVLGNQYKMITHEIDFTLQGFNRGERP